VAESSPLLLLVLNVREEGKKVKYIDLSQKIDHDIPGYPGDIKVSLVRDKSIDADKYNAYSLSTGLHAGTHIDCPMHLLKSEKTIAEYPLESFIGRGCLIDARAESEIDYKAEYDNKICQRDIVLILTGVDALYGGDHYYNDHPVITEKLARFFVSREIKMLGVDMPSPDFSPFPVHKILLANGIFILENLAKLDQLIGTGHFEVHAVPLKIYAEASLTRAFAISYIE